MFDFDQFIWTFIFHIINAIILYLILRRFLFKPVKKFLDERENRFKQRVKEINEKQSQVEKLKTEYVEKLEQAKTEAASIIDQANELAAQHIKEGKEKARKELESMLKRGRNQIESERNKAMDELKVNSAKMAVEIASKILQKNITMEDNQKIIDEFLERVK